MTGNPYFSLKFSVFFFFIIGVMRHMGECIDAYTLSSQGGPQLE